MLWQSTREGWFCRGEFVEGHSTGKARDSRFLVPIATASAKVPGLQRDNRLIIHIPLLVFLFRLFSLKVLQTGIVIVPLLAWIR